MSFYDTYIKYNNFNINDSFSNITIRDADDCLKKEKLEVEDFLAFLSPSGEGHIELMAQKAHKETLKYFGKTIQLYTPVYLSNYCSNNCVYCGFNLNNKITRKKLTKEELEAEAKFIFDTGLRHVLILTGESRENSPVSYIKDCIKLLKKYFSSISIEIYPLSEIEYLELIETGIDGLTIYQEVYDEKVYDRVHLSGPKKDYRFRIDAPERAVKSGMRNVNIGVLLGLSEWRKEVFLLGLHAKYLQGKFPEVDIAVSFPRLRPQTGNFRAEYEISDKNLVQAMLAIRLFLPRAGITISTREGPVLRKNLLPLGVTKMSAGSTTHVGGHTLNHAFVNGSSSSQFEISDRRTVTEIKAMLEENGYQAVLKDWMQL